MVVPSSGLIRDPLFIETIQTSLLQAAKDLLTWNGFLTTSITEFIFTKVPKEPIGNTIRISVPLQGKSTSVPKKKPLTKQYTPVSYSSNLVLKESTRISNGRSKDIKRLQELLSKQVTELLNSSILGPDDSKESSTSEPNTLDTLLERYPELRSILAPRAGWL